MGESGFAQKFEPFTLCDGSYDTMCAKNISKSVPSLLDGEIISQINGPTIVTKSCEEAASEGLVSDSPDYCFSGTKIDGMSDDDFEVLSKYWSHRYEIMVHFGLV